MSDRSTDTAADREPEPDREPRRDTLDTDAMRWVSALTALVGLWIITSASILGSVDASSYSYVDPAYWNNMVVGTGIFLLAGYNFYRLARDRLANVGVAALTLLLGVWSAITPFVMEMEGATLAISTMVSGLVVALLAAYTVYSNRKADAPERARMRV